MSRCVSVHVSKRRISRLAPFLPASGLDHMGARHHLPARRSGGSSPGVCHVDDGHRQRPDIPPGCSFMDPCPSTPGSTRVRSSSASGRSCSGSSSPTPSTIFCSPASMRANPPAHAAPRLLSLPRCLWDCRQSYCAYCLIGPMAALCFRNRSGIPRAYIPTRTFSRRFSPRSTLRTSRCAPVISHTPTRVHWRPPARQIADHVTLLFCDACKTEAEAQ